MATPTDKQILADANKRLNKNYASINDYLTDNGRLKKDGAGYKRRLTEVQNARGTATRTAFATSGKWNDYINEKYGWLVSVYNSNPEVAGIIRDAYVKDEPADQVTQKINNSKWALGLQVGEYDYLKGTSTNDRSYLDKLDVQKVAVKAEAAKNGYTLTDQQLNTLSASALKAGWDSVTLTNKVGEAVVSTAKSGGVVMGGAPTATTPTSLQAGADAASLKALAKSYGLKLSDSDIEGYTQSVVSGGLTPQQVKDQFRNQAKSLYPSLSSQLDSGTVNDATATYRSIAAQTLGIDSTAIDFSDATKFGKLLTYQDPKSGESRLMNSTEWTQYLRALPEWGKTSEAKSQYSGIIDTVSKIFGKVG